MCTHTPCAHTPHRVTQNHRQPISLSRKLCFLDAISPNSSVIDFVFMSSFPSLKPSQEERLNMGFTPRPESNEKGEAGGVQGREPAWWRHCVQC